VQNGSDFDVDLHQSEEIIEDTNEAEEVPFDIDADDDAVLDAILTPCAAHDAETEREIQQENSEDIFPQEEPKYDSAGFTLEDRVIDHIQLNETTKAAVAVTENAEDQDDDVFAEADNFDLDFNETEEEPDNTPDFF